MQEPLAIEPAGGVPMPANMQTLQWMPQIQAYARIMKQAGFFNDKTAPDNDPKAFEKNAAYEAKAEAKMVYMIAIGVDMGLTPSECIQGLYVNRAGKVEPTVELIKEKITQHPHYDYNVLGVTEDKCAVEFLYDGKKIDKPGNPVIWDINKAKKRKLLEGKNAHMYENWGSNMLLKQCFRDGQKFFLKGLFRGQHFEINVLDEADHSEENVVRGQAKEEVEAEARDAIQAALDAEGSTIQIDTVTIIETGEMIAKPAVDAVILKEAEIYRERGDEEKAAAKEDAVKISSSQKTQLTQAACANGWHPADVPSYVREQFKVANTADLTISQWETALAYVKENKPKPPESFVR